MVVFSLIAYGSFMLPTNRYAQKIEVLSLPERLM